MGCNEARAWIRFPAVLMDEEVKALLTKEHDVNFKDGHLIYEESERDIYIENGVFMFSGEVCYGYFPELEKLLVEKVIPFDRVTFSDYAVTPVQRIFRPKWEPAGLDGQGHAPNHFDHTYPLDDDANDVVVSVEKIREFLNYDPPDAWKTIENLTEYLDRTFPTYPPLENFVPEIVEEKVNLKAAVEGIKTVDFSRFPGLYDMIPWEALEAAAEHE